MDSKKLEALAVAVEQGSFTRAAEILGYTQSGLTHMMNSMEKDIGFSVLVRSRSGVRLTAPGQRIYPFIKDCLAANQALEREIGMVNSHREETIRVAAYASIATHWLPEIIEQFRRQYPDINVDIKMGTVEEVYSWTREDKVDMAFASRQEGTGLAWTPLKDDPLLAILPCNYPVDGQRTFNISRFQDCDFLMPSMGFDLDIMRVLNSQGVSPRVQTTKVSDGAILSMVEHGLGVSILSELVLRGRRFNAQTVPIEPISVRELGIAHRPTRELRHQVGRFIRFAKDMIEKM